MDEKQEYSPRLSMDKLSLNTNNSITPARKKKSLFGRLLGRNRAMMSETVSPLMPLISAPANSCQEIATHDTTRSTVSMCRLTGNAMVVISSSTNSNESSMDDKDESYADSDDPTGRPSISTSTIRGKKRSVQSSLYENTTRSTVRTKPIIEKLDNTSNKENSKSRSKSKQKSEKSNASNTSPASKLKKGIPASALITEEERIDCFTDSKDSYLRESIQENCFVNKKIEASLIAATHNKHRNRKYDLDTVMGFCAFNKDKEKRYRYELNKDFVNNKEDCFTMDKSAHSRESHNKTMTNTTTSSSDSPRTNKMPMPDNSEDGVFYYGMPPMNKADMDMNRKYFFHTAVNYPYDGVNEIGDFRGITNYKTGFVENPRARPWTHRENVVLDSRMSLKLQFPRYSIPRPYLIR